VRVWRGFRLPSLSIQDFYTKLGAVFIPATVKMQIEAGLFSYIPAVTAGLQGKPDSVPDETAILFWESQDTYSNGFARLAVRTYTLTHNGVYVTENNQSRADFPLFFSGSLNVDQPVYLFKKAADWMHGTVRHVVAGRPANLDPATFRVQIGKFLTGIQANPTLDGAIACLGNDYLVYWELEQALSGTDPGSNTVASLKALLLNCWHQVLLPAPTSLPVGLWDIWPGMEVKPGSSFNMQFDRIAVDR
jgi:hypothetical protein